MQSSGILYLVLKSVIIKHKIEETVAQKTTGGGGSLRKAVVGNCAEDTTVKRDADI